MIINQGVYMYFISFSESIDKDVELMLFEQALAAPGDCDFGEASYINGINKRALRSIKDPKFFRIPDTEGMFGIGTYVHDDNAYILFSVDYDAIDNRDRAKYLAAVQLEPLNDKFKLSRFGFDNIYKVSGVETDKKERYKGFGFLLYTLLLTEYKMDIVGDYMHCNDIDITRIKWLSSTESSKYIKSLKL